MDRTGIIVVTLCVVLLAFWFVGQQKYAQQQARYAATNQAVRAQSQFAAASSNPVSPTLNMTPTAELPIFDTNTPEELRVITNARACYTFTSRGGGLKSVELLDYPETVSARWKKKVAKDGVATLNLRAPVPVLAILGDASLVGDGNFTLTQTADGVRAEKSFDERPADLEGIPSQLKLSREGGVCGWKTLRTSRLCCPRRNGSWARRRRWGRTTTA